MQVPVRALSHVATQPSDSSGPVGLIWYLQGGFNNLDFDTGPADNSLVGAVLLGVGAYPSKGYEIDPEGEDSNKFWP